MPINKSSKKQWIYDKLDQCHFRTSPFFICQRLEVGPSPYIIRIYQENVLLKKKEENVVYVLFVHKNTATKMLNMGNHNSLRKLANMTITTIAWRFWNFFLSFHVVTFDRINWNSTVTLKRFMKPKKKKKKKKAYELKHTKIIRQSSNHVKVGHVWLYSHSRHRPTFPTSLPVNYTCRLCSSPMKRII